jgi:hypothetical protein
MKTTTFQYPHAAIQVFVILKTPDDIQKFTRIKIGPPDLYFLRQTGVFVRQASTPSRLLHPRHMRYNMQRYKH